MRRRHHDRRLPRRGHGVIGELVHCDFSQYPNLARWYGAMKARPNWAKVNETFYGFVGSFKDKTFEVV